MMMYDDYDDVESAICFFLRYVEVGDRCPSMKQESGTQLF